MKQKDISFAIKHIVRCITEKLGIHLLSMLQGKLTGQVIVDENFN